MTFMKFCICKTTGQKFHDSHFPGDCPTSGPLPPSKISQGGGSSCWCDSGRGRGGEKRVVTAANDGALTCRRCEISVCFVLLHLKNESCLKGTFSSTVLNKITGNANSVGQAKVLGNPPMVPVDLPGRFIEILLAMKRQGCQCRCVKSICGKRQVCL